MKKSVLYVLSLLFFTLTAFSAKADCGPDDICLSIGTSDSAQSVFYVTQIYVPAIGPGPNGKTISVFNVGPTKLQISSGSADVYAIPANGPAMKIGTLPQPFINFASSPMESPLILSTSLSYTVTDKTNTVCMKASHDAVFAMDSWVQQLYKAVAFTFTDGGNSVSIAGSRFEGFGSSRVALFGCPKN